LNYLSYPSTTRSNDTIQHETTTQSLNKSLPQTNLKQSKTYVYEGLLKLQSKAFGIHRATAATKPIMHTYIDRSDQYVEEGLLTLWIKSWRDAGWEVRLLTPEDAKKHANYAEYNKALRRSKVCCLPLQTYLRHLAMSTIEEGGFFSEIYVFPLRQYTYPEVKDGLLPNGGNFTSWDGIFGSHMSGSHDEWNRMTKILMENIEKNVVLSLQKLHNESPNSFHHENLVSDSSALLSNNQFRSDLCTVFEEFSSIRFHPNEMNQRGIDVEDKLAIVSSWFNVHKARCWGDRPLIFTFYEPVSYLMEESPDDLIEVWKSSWSEAGWEPVVLNMGDAKRHPNYKFLAKTLDDGLQFADSKDKYNYFCFIRWVAMAASGGGWMADYDTFPLNLPASFELPNNGSFTGHASFIPNLLSGSSSEWNRMIGLLFHAFSRHNRKEFYSDLYAAKDLFEQKSSFVASEHTAQLHDFYADEISDPNTKWRRIDPYDFTNKCHISDDYVAIHFSHWTCGLMWFCKEESHKDIDGNPINRFRRSEVAKKWLEARRLQCEEK